MFFHELLLLYRSMDFRPSYGRLAEIHSLLPPSTPYMACTATATKSIQKDVVQTLEMPDCTIVSMSPDRPNIFYQVKLRTEMETDLSDLLTSLRENSINTPRVIVYCRSLNMCSELYAHFHFELGDASYCTFHLVLHRSVTTDCLVCIMQTHHNTTRTSLLRVFDIEMG